MTVTWLLRLAPLTPHVAKTLIAHFSLIHSHRSIGGFDLRLESKSHKYNLHPQPQYIYDKDTSETSHRKVQKRNSYSTWIFNAFESCKLRNYYLIYCKKLLLNLVKTLDKNTLVCMHII